MSVKFVDGLPPGGGSHNHWIPEAQALRERPGQWAVIDVKDSAAKAGGAARNINRGLIKVFQPAGAFEAASRTIDGEHRVYVRYVGEPDG